MSNDLAIRHANIEDLPLIVEIYNSTISSRMVTADLEPVTIADKADWFNEHHSSKRPLWMIEYQGERCGWVSFQSFYGRPAYDATAEISIYIHHEFRGKGAGKFALTEAIAACPELQIETLLGFIFAHNKPSLQLFSSFGFEQWAHLPEVAELDGIKRDLMILGKRILPTDRE